MYGISPHLNGPEQCWSCEEKPGNSILDSSLLSLPGSRLSPRRRLHADCRDYLTCLPQDRPSLGKLDMAGLELCLAILKPLPLLKYTGSKKTSTSLHQVSSKPCLCVLRVSEPLQVNELSLYVHIAAPLNGQRYSEALCLCTVWTEAQFALGKVTAVITVYLSPSHLPMWGVNTASQLAQSSAQLSNNNTIC